MFYLKLHSDYLDDTFNTIIKTLGKNPKMTSHIPMRRNNKHYMKMTKNRANVSHQQIYVDHKQGSPEQLFPIVKVSSIGPPKDIGIHSLRTILRQATD